MARFGRGSTPQVGCQCYNALRLYSIAAAVAGGSAGPGDVEQNRKVAAALLNIPYRGVAGMIRCHQRWQTAMALSRPDA